MYAAILSYSIIASVVPPWDYYDQQTVGGNWNNLFWEGTFTTSYIDLGEFARFEYTFFLNEESMIPITDFTLVTLGEDMFEWDFEITGGSTLFITFETPQIGYTNAWGTLYNEDVFGSADVFETIAPIPAPGAAILLGAVGLTSRRRRV